MTGEVNDSRDNLRFGSMALQKISRLRHHRTALTLSRFDVSAN
jgi:hypothetical protein